MKSPKKCKDCDWIDYEAGVTVVICTLLMPWQEVDPEQEACEDFVETEE